MIIHISFFYLRNLINESFNQKIEVVNLYSDYFSKEVSEKFFDDILKIYPRGSLFFGSEVGYYLDNINDWLKTRLYHKDCLNSLDINDDELNDLFKSLTSNNKQISKLFNDTMIKYGENYTCEFIPVVYRNGKRNIVVFVKDQYKCDFFTLLPDVSNNYIAIGKPKWNSFFSFVEANGQSFALTKCDTSANFDFNKIEVCQKTNTKQIIIEFLGHKDKKVYTLFKFLINSHNANLNHQFIRLFNLFGVGFYPDPKECIIKDPNINRKISMGELAKNDLFGSW